LTQTQIKSQAESDHRSVEIKLLLEGLYGLSGYDFRDYDRRTIQARIENRLKAEGLDTVSRLQERILRDPRCRARLVAELSVNGHHADHHPAAWIRPFVKHAVPALKTYASVRIWNVGAWRPEEIFLLAALLEEAGLAKKTKIYVTDLSQDALDKAATGKFPSAAVRNAAGRGHGARALKGRVVFRGATAAFPLRLKKNIVFAQHGLATDGSFNEFHAVLSRNATVHFNAALRERALRLFHDSLCRLGFLILGPEESVEDMPFRPAYTPVDGRFYRRIR
jgi:chemotaxis protein methyltransferase CheR